MAKEAKTSEKIKVKLKKSLIGSTEKQVRVVKSLGLSKTNQVVEHFKTPIIMGMVNKVEHLLEVVQ